MKSIPKQDVLINVTVRHADVALIGAVIVLKRRKAIAMKQPSATGWGVVMPIVADGRGGQIGI